MTGAPVSNDLNSVAGARELPAKLAKMTRSCKETSNMPSTAAILTLLTDRDALKSCCEALTLETKVFLD